MKKKLLSLITCAVLATAADAAWQSDTYTNHQDVARVLYDQCQRLETKRSKPIDLLPMLHDRTVIFVDDDGRQIMRRDLAYAIIDEAGLAPKTVHPNRTKLICGCMVKGEWYRFHVPELADEDFQNAIKTIQQSLPPVSGTRGTPVAYAPVAPGIPER